MVKKKREHTERFKAAADRVRSGELDTAEILIPFEPSLTRPDTYPDDLPFLSETPVALTEFEGKPSRTLTWFFVQDAEERLKDLRLQLAEGGWREKGETNASTPFGTMTSLEFGMGGDLITVMINRYGDHSQIMLLEHSQDEDRFQA